MSFVFSKKISLEVIWKTYRRHWGQYYSYNMISVRMMKDWTKPHSTDKFLEIVKKNQLYIIGLLDYLNSMCPLPWPPHMFTATNFQVFTFDLYFLFWKEQSSFIDPWVKRKDNDSRENGMISLLLNIKLYLMTRIF